MIRYYIMHCDPGSDVHTKCVDGIGCVISPRYQCYTPVSFIYFFKIITVAGRGVKLVDLVCGK